LQLSIDQLVERYALLTTVAHPVTIPPTVLDDPDDDQVLACALAAKVEFIVSGDRHLLDLKEQQGIRMVTAAEIVRILGGIAL
jgi:predicted nucleic acid-binding protein